MRCDTGFVAKRLCWVAVCVSWASWASAQDLPAPDLPAPGLDIPVDVDGDGVSNFGDVFTFNWWLSTGASAKEVLASGKVNGKVLDLSDYFRELQASQSPEPRGGALDSVTSACNGGSEAALTERMPPNGFTTNSQQPTGGTSEHARVTPLGCFVTFSSAAGNLQYANGWRQIYRLEYRDGAPFALTHMSRRRDLAAGANEDCFRPSISDDGAKVAFESISSMGYSTVTVDPNRGSPGLDMEDRDIFVRDTSLGTPETRLLSIDPGQTAASGPSYFSAISGDGSLVAFTSNATDFGGGFTPSALRMNVYRASTDAPGGAEIVSVALNASDVEVLSDRDMQTAQDGQGGMGSVGHVISPDGSVVAFDGVSMYEWAGQLSDMNGVRQVYARDLRDPVAEQTLLVSSPDSTTHSRSPSLSALDASSIRTAYSWIATDTGIEQVFTKDLDLDTGDILATVWVSKVGFTNGDGHSIVPTLSRSGDFVAFASEATNLVPSDTNGDRDVFLKKSAGFEILRRSSVKTDGSQVDGPSGTESTSPDVTDDGAAVVFESTQTQLVSNDTNGYRDVFRRYEPFLNRFTRGDANQDGATDLSDAEYMLNALFYGGPQPECTDAADTQDDGIFNISDSIYLLAYLFSGGPAPPAPISVCGSDPTADTLSCDSFSECTQ